MEVGKLNGPFRRDHPLWHTGSVYPASAPSELFPQLAAGSRGNGRTRRQERPAVEGETETSLIFEIMSAWGMKLHEGL